MWNNISCQEANLAYVAQEDPALALKEFRRRRAAQPQNAHTPIRYEEIPDEIALANLCVNAAKVREMNAREGTLDYQLDQWAEKDPSYCPPCGVTSSEYKGHIARFDPTQADNVKKPSFVKSLCRIS